jgi:hypothetical protein
MRTREAHAAQGVPVAVQQYQRVRDGRHAETMTETALLLAAQA